MLFENFSKKLFFNIILNMICPVCHFQDTRVVDSRVSNDGMSIRRRRECLKCDFRFSTYEEVEILGLSVIKQNGTKDNYSRDKLVRGLKKAIEKRPIAENDFKKLINSIERDLQALNKSEVSSEKIGKIVMKYLKKIDKIAYIRFASVYRDFKDLEMFQEELDRFSRKKKK